MIHVEAGGLVLSDVNNADVALVTDVAADANLTITGEISGNGELIKQGSGTISLTGVNTYSSETIIAAGLIEIPGSIDPASAITIADGGVLGNANVEEIKITVQAGGTLSAADTSNSINSSDLLLMPEAIFNVDLFSDSQDQIIVNGTVEISDSILDFNLHHIPHDTQEMVILQNDEADPIVGTFVGLPEGGTIVAGGFRFAVSYQAGDGNDFALRLFETGEIAGSIWYDIDEDEEIGDDELRLSDWTVYLDTNSNAVLDDNEFSTATDQEGNYLFPALPEGAYEIRIIEESGWIKTSPIEQNASLEHVESLIDGENNVNHLRGTRSVAISPDGNFVYAVANNDDAIVVFRRDILVANCRI